MAESISPPVSYPSVDDAPVSRSDRYDGTGPFSRLVIGPEDVRAAPLGAAGATARLSVDPRDVTVLLATINERASLPGLLAEIERYCGSGVQIVVIDDGSSDGTREYLEQMANLNGSLRYLFNSAPQTIVGAHIQGITNSRTPYIVMMDSDGQHPPETIPKLLSALSRGKDVAVATRFGPGGSTGGRSAFRGLVSHVAAAMIKVTIGNTRSISDPTSGFFAVRRSSLVPFTRDLRGYETLVFVLAMMRRPRLSEVPYVFRERRNGDSKVIRGFSFFRVFFTQLVAAKRTELDARGRSTARPRPPAVSEGSPVARGPTVLESES